MVSKEQIHRFFAKQCTAEEANEVAAWLQAHPEEATLYLDEAEWQHPPIDEKMPQEIYDESWQQIQRKISLRKRYILLKRSAAAACIAGCVALGIFYIDKQEAVPVAVSSVYSHAATAEAAAIDTEYNLANKSRRIILTDNSVVSLSPKSMVWFDTPFAKTSARNIYLKGEARFDVAKNKRKPFTVYAGSFSTTALGTEFIVKEQARNIRVQLVHGKVVIQNTDHSVKNWENVYLLPGQQMIYNEGDAVAKVSSIEERKTATLTKPAAKPVTQRETADSLIFNGSAMTVVLQKLHQCYNVAIQYDSAEIKRISFTGVILKRDSVQTILKVIGGMNDLSVATTDSSFIITKKEN